ncbi:hypothetical protein PPSIR1_31958 [Plesiocystis pacifica SIR-1]|uniref:Uncharacterized protein n=1 Tax=Plesiocystis pacifica SIR-1 TaxID=391625 RepID=A6G2V9_9BACT|nr:hypothetical protein PPSIR1_31958 [Plesiocystis pacifica SIR-1]
MDCIVELLCFEFRCCNFDLDEDLSKSIDILMVA